MATSYLRRTLGAATLPRLVPQRGPIGGHLPVAAFLDPPPAARVVAAAPKAERTLSIVAPNDARFAKRPGDAQPVGDLSLPPAHPPTPAAARVAPVAYAGRTGTNDTPPAGESADPPAILIGPLSSDITSAGSPEAPTPAWAPPALRDHIGIETSILDVRSVATIPAGPAAPAQPNDATGSTAIPPKTESASTVRPATAIAARTAQAQPVADPDFPAAEGVTPPVWARSPAPPRTQPVPAPPPTQSTPTVRIGTIEVTIDPPIPVAPRRAPAPPTARLARGFTSFGWGQS